VSDFKSELTGLLNRHSMENASNTPDFLLANFLLDCYTAWNIAVKSRDDWHGFQTRFAAQQALTPPFDSQTNRNNDPLSNQLSEP
jgi:hypothetical protein